MSDRDRAGHSADVKTRGKQSLERHVNKDSQYCNFETGFAN